ncbi:6-bladed beta-propeller [Cyclobacterium roseum]|uniref:6-bladed beta-propeller n=1 Tax=Cyclobacterium roseum TaxID=2666137 RepID=UPI00139079AB|nr:6-bladed beta-propeller [Cyclobacterium roseum]
MTVRNNWLNGMFVITLLFSCETDKNIREGDRLDFSEFTSRNFNLLELSTEVEGLQLSLPDSIILGKIESIRYVHPYWLMHDPNFSKAIYLFDSAGNFVNSLQKAGEGPEEYLSLFSYLVWDEELIVYDRNLGKANWYSFPEFDYIKSKNVDYYIMDLIFLENQKQALAVFDDWHTDDSYLGIVFLDKDLRIVENFPKPPGLIEATQIGNLSDNNGFWYFTEPLSEMVYLLGKSEMQPVYWIDFGEFKIPGLNWGIDDADDFHELLQTREYAFAVHNFNLHENLISFNFYLGNPENVKLGLYDLNADQAVVIGEISTADDLFLRPLNVSAGYNLTVLYPDEYNEEMLMEIGLNLEWIKSIDIENPLMIKYRFNKIPNL